MNKFDDYLCTVGLVRKHIPRDVFSLYKCVSESVLLTQTKFEDIRENLVSFVRTSSLPFPVSVVRQLEDNNCPAEIDLCHIVALCFSRAVILYDESNPNKKSKSFGTGFLVSAEPITLVLCKIEGKSHFDLVITQTRMVYQAMAQCKFTQLFWVFN